MTQNASTRFQMLGMLAGWHVGWLVGANWLLELAAGRLAGCQLSTRKYTLRLEVRLRICHNIRNMFAFCAVVESNAMQCLSIVGHDILAMGGAKDMARTNDGPPRSLREEALDFSVPPRG